MTELYVDQQIRIRASAQTVWEVLTLPKFTSRWVGQFQSVFTVLDSDWALGSPIYWRTAQEKVLVDGKITRSESPKKLSFTVRDVSGNFDSVQTDEDGIFYELTEADGITSLRVRQGDFGKVPEGDKYYRITDESWERAMGAIKGVAESISKVG
jgi:uncharacterized protein YndB with AHSA1/START domain